MRRLIFLIFLLNFVYQSFGQTKIYFYGATLTAKEILGCKGKKCRFEPPEADLPVKQLDQPIPMNEIYEYLGRNYSIFSKNKASKFLLANTIERNVSALDSINFDFFEREGIPKLDLKYGNDEEYRRFRQEFISNIENSSALKAILRSPNYAKYKLALDSTRVKVTIVKNISYSKNISKKIELGLSGL
jgi:hypothetical protein